MPTFFWIDLFLEAREEIFTKNLLVFWSIWRHQKDILKLNDLYQEHKVRWINLLENEGAQKINANAYPKIDLNPLQCSRDVSFISIHVKL